MNIYEKIKNLNGWLTIDEANLLYALARKTKGAGRIVEIGSWKGRSTICLAAGARESGREKIIAIDPHTGSSEHQSRNPGVNTFAEFQKNIADAGVADFITPKVMTSRQAAQNFAEPVELCFIDGAHEYEFVNEDFKLWFPKVINGGVMAFHDTISWPGPKKIVAEKIFRSPYFKNTGFTDSISFGAKTAQNNFFDRLRNRYILCLKNTFEASRKIKKKMKFLGVFNPLVRKIFRAGQ
jgi:predicted O-methyltransferase YrrM